jgi:peptide chain release factor subunit 1
VTLRNSVSNEETTLMLSKEQEADASLYKDKETGAELEVIERQPLLEWLANNYKKFGCQLEFITNKSQARLQHALLLCSATACPMQRLTRIVHAQEGSQFCRGFGGIGGLLRYSVDLSQFEAADEEDGPEWDSDEDI